MSGLVGQADAELAGPGIGFVLQETILIRTFLEGDIRLVAHVHELDKALHAVGEAILGGGVDLEVVLHEAVGARIGAQLVEILVAIGGGEAERQAFLLVAEHGVPGVLRSGWQRDGAEAAIAIRHVAIGIGIGVVEADKDAVEQAGEEVQRLLVVQLKAFHFRRVAVHGDCGLGEFNTLEDAIIRGDIILEGLLDDEVLDILWLCENGANQFMMFASEQEAAMGRFVEGEDRAQQVLLPPSLEDYVGEDNPVRVVDVYVDELDLAELGFARVMPKATGRPAYHPSTLLKIYLYGYLNRIQSSRRLEREAGRNIELMWLTGRLAPDFKTIADFRKDNGPAIQAVCAQFIALCREIGLFAKAVAAIDGAKFKAVNARDRNFTRGKLKRRIEQVETSIGRYLQSLDAADAQEGDVAEEKVGRLREKVAAMKAKLQELKSLEATVIASPDHQISLTDPDARAMATSLRASGMVGYNVQTAVDTEHHLIVAHEVTNDVNDKAQLSPMAMKARSAMGTDTLDVLADRGYFSGWEILACNAQDISPLVPKPYTSGAKAAGRYGKDDFLYDPDENAYRCPAGEMLTYRFTNVEKGQTLHSYWTTRCETCALKPHCTTGPFRRIKRWEHEGVVDAMLKRLNGMPDAMNIRRRTVEHPFGTLKSWMGHTHFLTRGIEKVKTEMSLCVLAYNLKRMIAILGVGPLITAIRA